MYSAFQPFKICDCNMGFFSFSAFLIRWQWRSIKSIAYITVFVQEFL